MKALPSVLTTEKKEGEKEEKKLGEKRLLVYYGNYGAKPGWAGKGCEALTHLLVVRFLACPSSDYVHQGISCRAVATCSGKLVLVCVCRMNVVSLCVSRTHSWSSEKNVSCLERAQRVEYSEKVGTKAFTQWISFS